MAADYVSLRPHFASSELILKMNGINKTTTGVCMLHVWSDCSLHSFISDSHTNVQQFHDLVSTDPSTNLF